MCLKRDIFGSNVPNLKLLHQIGIFNPNPRVSRLPHREYFIPKLIKLGIFHIRRFYK